MSWTKKRNKYGNVKTVFMGESFDSKLECERYKYLLACQQRGEITELERQVPFPLTAHGKPVCKYVADFVYALPGGALRVEDTKSEASMTADFRLKKKLFEAQEGIPLRIITKDNLTDPPNG